VYKQRINNALTVFLNNCCSFC